mmetsp:Transcript_49840/g.138444  ORF Transcript_49840/g.138444 Transcript_49840/m.138444 type:complete len:215 (-) Transcript_49840:258-902(-)
MQADGATFGSRHGDRLGLPRNPSAHHLVVSDALRTPDGGEIRRSAHLNGISSVPDAILHHPSPKRAVDRISHIADPPQSGQEGAQLIHRTRFGQADISQREQAPWTLPRQQCLRRMQPPAGDRSLLRAQAELADGGLPQIQRRGLVFRGPLRDDTSPFLQRQLSQRLPHQRRISSHRRRSLDAPLPTTYEPIECVLRGFAPWRLRGTSADALIS